MKKLNAMACALAAMLPAVAAADGEFKKFFHSDNPFDPTFTQNLTALVEDQWPTILVAVLLIIAVVVFSRLRAKNKKQASADGATQPTADAVETADKEAKKEEK